ncbi:hypothetical protein QAD02_001581 [Eretmocerus hayati]|uniref:Uncharacterized protein n=1 Tax=Eretmocerus hayati TaxID=131215 RepID=A0ACC2NGV1_9HYME|nr:hypothetical protein QAD02_001581 [Eretmocerus hayati]
MKNKPCNDSAQGCIKPSSDSEMTLSQSTTAPPPKSSTQPMPRRRLMLLDRIISGSWCNKGVNECSILFPDKYKIIQGHEYKPAGDSLYLLPQPKAHEEEKKYTYGDRAEREEKCIILVRNCAKIYPEKYKVEETEEDEYIVNYYADFLIE